MISGRFTYKEEPRRSMESLGVGEAEMELPPPGQRDKSRELHPELEGENQLHMIQKSVSGIGQEIMMVLTEVAAELGINSSKQKLAKV